MPAFTRFGRGRQRPQGMNKLEREYAEHLEIRRIAGEVLWWAYEPIKFRLAASTFYTPDFGVMLANGEVEFHETKGFWEDDARVKIKCAADKFPFRFIALKKLAKKHGGGFAVEEF